MKKEEDDNQFKKPITKEESEAFEAQLIPVYEKGKLLTNETFQDVVKRIGSDKLVSLHLLRNDGKVNLDDFLHHDFSYRHMGIPERDCYAYAFKVSETDEGLVIKEDGFLHHEFPVKHSGKGRIGISKDENGQYKIDLNVNENKKLQDEK